MKKYFYILLSIILLVVSSVGWAQDVPDTVQSAPGIVIESSVDKAEIYIGDLINYRLTITYDSGITLMPPPIGANLGAFDVKDYQMDEQQRLDDGSIKIESRFVLTTFTTGDYIIPPIPVEYTLPDSTAKILISEPVPIRVKSLLADNADSADIRDLKGLIEFKPKISFWYYMAGGVLLLVIVAILVWWKIRRGRERPTGPIDTRKPWEIASERLAVLKEKNYFASGEFKQFYIELTDIIREFLQRVYEIPVLDMTTYEFLTAIIQHDIEEQLYNRLKQFLEFADLVKFAKLIPELEKVNSDFDEAVMIVDYIRQNEINRLSTPVGMTADSVSGGENV
jgi:hypothetical protein